MSNSTHRVEVVPVTLTKHPNADALSIVKVWGYQAIVRTSDWSDGDLGAYCPPDSVVPPGLVPGIEGRVKAKRLRGVWSEGLLVKAPIGAKVGDDVAGALGITHYDPPMAASGADAAPAPKGPMVPTYDLEAAAKWADAVFRDYEPVVITEKIHGANARFTFRDRELHIGSRTQWKRYEPIAGNPWGYAVARTPDIERWCRDNPGAVLYGEVYGQVQDLRYGVTSGSRFVAFDVLGSDGRWLDHQEMRTSLTGYEIDTAPLLYVGPWHGMDAAREHAEGLSVLARGEHVREGCVVRPLHERWDERCGRVVLKIIGRGYMERA
jgi:RNA ligase (TIGR02306 family)